MSADAPLFDGWIETQGAWQQSVYKMDYASWTPRQRNAYIDEMCKAAILEVGEAYDEFSWKSWASNDFLNRDALVGEVVDVLFFMSNVLAALDVTSEELRNRYRDKMEINAARQSQGYDTSTTKCPKCKRALDDSAVTCTATVCSQEV